MDQVDIINDEEQSPLHIKRELDIDIPYRVAFPICYNQQQKDTPKTAMRTIEHLEIDEVQIQTETTPKTQIDISSPRVLFLTHSQIIGINQEEDEVPFNRSTLNYPLSEIPEELTPSNLPNQSKVSNQDVIIDNMSIVNSQQLKFSKKSSETNVISNNNMDGSKLKEELKEQISILESKIQELEKENFILKKRSNQEKVRLIELQMETEYKIAQLNEQLQDQEINYKKQINILKNDLNNAKLSINIFKQQIPYHENQGLQLSQSQIQFPQQQIQYPYNSSQQQNYQYYNKQQLTLSQSYNEQLNKNTKDLCLTQIQYEIIYSKLIKIIKKIDQQIEINKIDLFDLLQILEEKVKQIVNIDEEEKIDEHRTLLSTLKTELGQIKQIRGQLSRIFNDNNQFIHKRNNDNQIDQRINELNLQILGIKQEKLELFELNQKQQNQINQQNQIIIELQSKLNNSSQTDTQRIQSQFIRQLQTNSMSDIKNIKEQVKQRQDSIKKNFKSQNSPQSRSENASPQLKFLNSPKNSKHSSTYQKQQSIDKKYQFYNRTSDFSVDNNNNNSIHQPTNINNSMHLSGEIIQKLVDQFKGNSILAQKIQGYSKKN
ncbi:unnamed protein product [Paramecium primaurelia]|uniref:Uncharacterized protein n=1 Tax=Paramecium primaurelia TaxID=5886 RepID=A0A8S1QKA2_PARPR|nr:unnamed protein product [Paramecium primaurelia]